MIKLYFKTHLNPYFSNKENLPSGLLNISIYGGRGISSFDHLYWIYLCCLTRMVFSSVLLKKQGLRKAFIKTHNFIQTQLMS